jgi:hypothetical protein
MITGSSYLVDAIRPCGTVRIRRRKVRINVEPVLSRTEGEMHIDISDIDTVASEILIPPASVVEYRIGVLIDYVEVANAYNIELLVIKTKPLDHATKIY